MCTQGYTVAAGATNTFWASDLLHRVFHVEAITEGLVSHIADDYDTSLELALEDPVAAIGNSDSLQYFALEVYASRIAVPGVGCLGEVVEEVNEVHATTAPAAVVETAVPETATSTDAHVHAVETTAAAVAAGKECHTHDDGVEHCS